MYRKSTQLKVELEIGIEYKLTESIHTRCLWSTSYRRKSLYQAEAFELSL